MAEEWINEKDHPAWVSFEDFFYRVAGIGNTKSCLERETIRENHNVLWGSYKRLYDELRAAR